MVFPSENRLGGSRVPLCTSIELFDDRGQSLGTVIDLSVGGLCVQTPRLLQMNRRTSVTLNVASSSISIRGVLVWARKGNQPRTFQMGMRFDRLSQAATDGIEELLQLDDAAARASEKAS